MSCNIIMITLDSLLYFLFNSDNITLFSYSCDLIIIQLHGLLQFRFNNENIKQFVVVYI